MASQIENVAHAALVAATVLTPSTSGVQTLIMGGKNLFLISPTGACTFDAIGGHAGQRANLIITTVRSSTYMMTFRTNFKAAGVLYTGVTIGKVFQISFICKDGTLWVEEGRTAAM